MANASTPRTLRLSNFAPNAGVMGAGGGGTASNQFGHLSVSGAATLSGTLQLNVVNGFSPAIGNTFPVLTYGSRTGQFTTLNGQVIGNGNQFTTTYNATNLTLGVTAAPPAPARITTTPATQGNPSPGAATIHPGDTLQLSALTRTPEGARFRFPTAAGRQYRLEGTPDLTSGKWTVLLDHIPGEGQILELLDTKAGTLPRYFYRIIETR